jgi:hypothetical protein
LSGEQNFDRYSPKNFKKISEIFGYQKNAGIFSKFKKPLF